MAPRPFFLIVILSVCTGWTHTPIAAAGLQDGFPLAIGHGPARFAWNTASTAIALQFNGPIPAAVEIARLARVGNDRAWHLAETVHATLSGAGHISPVPSASRRCC